MSRFTARTLIESLESRNLMAADLGLIGAVPPLSSNTFLMSQIGGAAAPQLNSGEGVNIALGLQTTSTFDLTSNNPSAGLAQTFPLGAVPAPTLLPNSLVVATPLE